MKTIHFFTPALLIGFFISPLAAEERTHTAKQMEELSKGDLISELKSGPPKPWTVGASGIVGPFVGNKFQGDQFQGEGYPERLTGRGGNPMGRCHRRNEWQEVCRR